MPIFIEFKKQYGPKFLKYNLMYKILVDLVINRNMPIFVKKKIPEYILYENIEHF